MLNTAQKSEIRSLTDCLESRCNEIKLHSISQQALEMRSKEEAETTSKLIDKLKSANAELLKVSIALREKCSQLKDQLDAANANTSNVKLQCSSNIEVCGNKWGELGLD